MATSTSNDEAATLGDGEVTGNEKPVTSNEGKRAFQCVTYDQIWVTFEEAKAISNEGQVNYEWATFDELGATCNGLMITFGGRMLDETT
jgi:hypothetical protein